MKRKIIDFIHVALIAITLFVAIHLLSSCSADSEQEGSSSSPQKELTEVRLNLGVAETRTERQDGANRNTRANTSDPDDSDNAVTGEMMRNWFVVIVQEGKIVDLVKSADFYDQDGERDEDDVLVKIPSSEEGIETTFYSFANIQPSALGLGEAKAGDAFPTDFDSKTYKVDGNFGVFADHMTDFETIINQMGGIPMSNKQTMLIKKDTKSVQLEVIRMLAKVKLQVKNITGHTIKMVGLTISDVTPNSSELTQPTLSQSESKNKHSEGEDKQNLKLLPGKSNEQGTQVIETNLNTSEKQVMRLQAMRNNNGLGYNIAPGTTQDICFYMNESEATAENKYFVLQLQTEDNDNTGTKVNRRLAMLDWRKICRNDYRIIPIELGDYAIEWNVEAFTPIGVLPEVEDDGENLTITMGYYGEFHIAPVMRELSTGYTGEILSGDFTYVDGDKSVFDIEPAWSQAGMRVEGEMANNSGIALYSLSLTARKPFGTEQITLTRKVRFVMEAVNLYY